AAAVLAVVQGDKRERKLRVALEPLAYALLDAHVHPEERALARLVVLDLPDALGDRPFGAEKELQQEVVAEGFLPRRNREPAGELLAALVSERVDLAIGLAALLLTPSLGQPLGGEPIQDRIDLPVALVPEVSDRSLDELLDVVAGHRAEAQHAEDRKAARAPATR